MTLPPTTQRWVDTIANAEPLTSARLMALTAAVILGALDSRIGFSEDPLLTALAVAGVVQLVTWFWERGRVWSAKSHEREVAEAYREGTDSARGA